MSSPDYTYKMTQLRKMVGGYMPNKTIGVLTPIKMYFSKISSILSFNSPIIYIIIPLIVMILLVLFKPNFITVEIGEIGDTTRKRSVKKILITSLIIGMIIDIALFSYTKKTD